MMRLLVFVILLAAASSATARDDGARSATFDVGGTSFIVPLAPGYCEPSGKQIVVAQMLAAADTDSRTDLSLMACDGLVTTGASQYTLIKTPVKFLALSMDRPVFLAAIAPEFDKGQVPVDNAKLSRDTAKSLERVTGVKAEMAMAMAMRGHDDACGYIGGTTQISAPGVNYVQAIGGCITTVGGRVIEVFRYGTQTDAAGIDRLMKEARALALTIRPMAAKP